MCPKLKVTSDKVGYLTVMDVYDRLSSVKEVEGTIYRILTLSNKLRLARETGASRSGLYRKIKTRTLSVSELYSIFSILRDSKEEDKVDTARRYRPQTIEEFNRMNRFRTRTTVKRRKVIDEKEDIDGEA